MAMNLLDYVVSSVAERIELIHSVAVQVQWVAAAAAISPSRVCMQIWVLLVL